MLESQYQAELIRQIQERLPGSFVLKNDALYYQGIPDLIVLYKNRWAMLEVKPSAHSRLRVNQEYYIDLFSDMSFASFIYPENEMEVLNEVHKALEPSW